MKKIHALGRLAASMIVVVGSMFAVAVAGEVKIDSLKPENAKPSGFNVMKPSDLSRSMQVDATKHEAIESAGLDTAHTGPQALPSRK